MKCVVKNNSSMDMGPILPLLKSLLPYTRKKLGFNRPPSLFFASDTENAAKPLGKTAFYDPAEVSITVFVDGRHPKDILRSISHELVHHMQHERGDFGADMDTGEGYAQKNDALRELEREAYESGNMCFRDWEDENRKALQEVKKHFNKENEKMSAKKKRNNNVESLLMKKWGFKEQTRQEFNIEVPDAKKSVLSEDLARYIVKEAIKKAEKSLIKEADKDTAVNAVDLSRELSSEDPNVRNPARKTFSDLFKSDNPYNKDIAIKSIPIIWHKALDNELGSDINANWYFRQKGIFDSVDDYLNLDPLQKDTDSRDAHIGIMKGKVIDKVNDIDTEVRGRTGQRMKPFGLDSDGKRMRIDRERKKSGRYSAEKIANSDLEWQEKKRSLRSDMMAKEGWEDMEQEAQTAALNNAEASAYKEFVKDKPWMLTAVDNPYAVVNPVAPSWWHGQVGPDRGDLVASATNTFVSDTYNQLVKSGKIKNPDAEGYAPKQDGVPEVSWDDFTQEWAKGVSDQSAETLKRAGEYADSLKTGAESLLSKQDVSGFKDKGQFSLGVGSGFEEVLATEYAPDLDDLFLDAAGTKAFQLIRDKWEALPVEDRPAEKELGNWLTTAKDEAEAQVGPRSIFNLRDQRNKTIRSFVPDYTEDLTGRARNPQAPAPELGFFDSIKDFVVNAPEHFDTGVKNFKRGAGVLNPFGDGEQGAYKDWAAGEKEAGRTVVPYDEYTAYRDIMDERPGEWTKVPQGPQNEDLIRKVVQEALKRKFGE